MARRGKTPGIRAVCCEWKTALAFIHPIYGIRGRRQGDIRPHRFHWTARKVNGEGKRETPVRRIAERTGANDLQSFTGKVQDKAAWARRLFISTGGFTKVEVFGRVQPILCMDGLDLYVPEEPEPRRGYRPEGPTRGGDWKAIHPIPGVILRFLIEGPWPVRYIFSRGRGPSCCLSRSLRELSQYH